MKYRVEKKMRDGQAEWFGFGPVEFSTREKATEYLCRFASEQIDAKVSEVRFVLESQAGPRKHWQTDGEIYNSAKYGRVIGNLAHLLGRA